MLKTFFALMLLAITVFQNGGGTASGEEQRVLGLLAQHHRGLTFLVWKGTP
jgi:hypothetical protein